jgi:glycosyltransferase involved in cell wall biosynthesis
MIGISCTGECGVTTYVQRIIPLLREQGIEVWLAANTFLKKNNDDEYFLLVDYDNIKLYGSYIAKFMKEHQINIFYSHMTSANNMGAYLRLWYDIISVAHIHKTMYELNTILHDELIHVSNYTHKCYKFVLNQGIIIPNFIPEIFKAPDNKMDKCPELPLSKHIIISPGTSWRKGYDLALKIIKYVRTKYSDAILVIIGNNPTGMDIEGVVYLAFRTDLHNILPYADIVLVPARNESFGLFAAEAMACGVPVVANAQGKGLCEIVSGGGVLATGVQGMTNAILYLFDTPQDHKKVGQRGADKVNRLYRTDSHIQNLITTLSNVKQQNHTFNLKNWI